MATEQQTQQTRPASSAKFETFVDQQLARVKQRLRAIDLGAAVEDGHTRTVPCQNQRFVQALQEIFQ